jgi:hypothetical protein
MEWRRAAAAESTSLDQKDELRGGLRPKAGTGGGSGHRSNRPVLLQQESEQTSRFLVGIMAAPYARLR